MRERSRSLTLAAATLVVAAALLLPAAASAQSGVATACPATFQVLHDDQIGRLSLPAGAYTVSVRGNLSCRSASDLFRQFLEDFRGALPGGWRYSAQGTGIGTFTRGSTGFSVAPASAPSGGGGGHHPHGGLCPGTFQVLHDDRIGTFAIPSGSYSITLLSVGRLSCSRAARYLARFLQDFDGVLPRPWFVDPETGSFMRGGRNVGFRIKDTERPPNPNGGGGGNHPTGDRCPGTFRVLNNDMIGRLRLARGPYRITLLGGGGLSCSAASRLFTSFLADFTGVLPRPWVLNVQTATFTRGRGGNTGFRVKPARQ
ncbi:MAG: hypothetical protein ACREX8_07715 [Gammaproteobacteria bacterium]